VGRWVHGIMVGSLVEGVLGGREGRVRDITDDTKKQS